MSADDRHRNLPGRHELRTRLLDERARFATGAGAPEATAGLGRELRAVVAELEPQCLGLYWPHRSEFNAAIALEVDEGLAKAQWALPFARRSPVEMHYRVWDRSPPLIVDECGIPSSEGAVVVPDVVLVPCVGYTESGLRLGYGGGYFDRWLALHPHVCAVGVAWSWSRLEDSQLPAASHDMPLALVVTEHGPV